MSRKAHLLKPFIMLVGDILLILAAFYLSPWLRFGYLPDLLTFFEGPDLSALLTCLLFFYIFDFYDIDARFDFLNYFFRFLAALIIANMIMITLFYIFNIRHFTTIILFLNALLILLLCLGWRFLFYLWNRSNRKILQVLIVGAGWAGTDLYKLLADKPDFDVVGFLDDDQEKWRMTPTPGAPQVIGGTDLLFSALRERHVDLIVIAITHDIKQSLQKRIVDAKMRGVAVYEMPAFCEAVFSKIPVQHISNRWLVYAPLSGVRKTTYNNKVKKIMDIMLSLGMLTVLSPVLLMAVVAIRLDSPGPVFYIQRRIGLRGRPFKLLKFRTMKVGLDDQREYAGQKDDPRITRLGMFMRLSRLDELPQLWNVLRGDMSLIGPRALMEEEVDEFTPQITFFSLRHSILPGITGWAQVSYPHGARVEDALAKLEYDFFYIKNLSPLLDMIILARTVRTVFFGNGAR
jgi:exopolysaccharide biosynthesis polyprenyl glycosylphosphotransferase